MKLKCVFCLKRIKTKHPHQKYCCLLCRDEHYKQLRKEKYKRQKLQRSVFKENCDGCGALFVVSNGRKRWCSKLCSRKSETARLEARDKKLRDRYGITIADYQEIYQKQSGLCVICDEDLSNSTRMAPVDHDHVTGKIRGLLCKFCNRGIGLFKDNPKLLEAAASYIRGNL